MSSNFFPSAALAAVSVSAVAPTVSAIHDHHQAYAGGAEPQSAQQSAPAVPRGHSSTFGSLYTRQSAGTPASERPSPSRERLLALTSIGKELVAMGRITDDALRLATAQYEKALRQSGGGTKPTFTSVLLAGRWVTAVDIEEAAQRQRVSRATRPGNDAETTAALARLRAMAHDYCAQGQCAVPAATAAGNSGPSRG